MGRQNKLRILMSSKDLVFILYNLITTKRHEHKRRSSVIRATTSSHKLGTRLTYRTLIPTDPYNCGTNIRVELVLSTFLCSLGKLCPFGDW